MNSMEPMPEFWTEIGHVAVEYLKRDHEHNRHTKAIQMLGFQNSVRTIETF